MTQHIPRISVLTTDQGERYAVLPLAEYERLLAAAAHVASLETCDVPDDFAARVSAGEHPIRILRESRGLSQKDLAARAEVSAAYLSQIEHGAREGTIGALRRLADALHVGLDEVTPHEREQRNAQVSTEAADRPAAEA